MTQYLLSVHNIADQPQPSMEEMQPVFEAVDRFNTKVQDAGIWVFAGGLHPADTATVVDNTKGGDVVITDGPFAEAKEQLGGFWIIECADLDTAMKWATEASAACANPVEVRPFQGED